MPQHTNTITYIYLSIHIYVYTYPTSYFPSSGQLPFPRPGLYMDLTPPSEAIDALELRRYCCRRMILTHVDLIEKLLKYNASEREQAKALRRG